MSEVKVDLTQNGEVGRVYVGAPADISVSGTSEENLKITVKKEATGVLVKSEMPVSVNAYGDVDLTLEKGAENSKVTMKNGKVYTNPGVKNPDIVELDGEPPDESVQVLRIDREGALPICMINFQTHPDVVGGETITADWPGLTRTVFEAATMGKAVSLVLNGTQGDVNHVNVMPLPGEENGLVNDFDNVPRGYSHAWHMANVLAGAALSVWLKCAPLEAGNIRFGTANVRVASQRAKTKEELELARKYWKLHQEGKDDQIPFKHMELTTELARSKRMVRLENGPDYFDLPICALAIGDAVAFAGFPGEPFNDIGKAVKKDSPFKLTVPLCLTNASRGYFPCSDSYVGGGYESASSAFAPEVADKLIVGQLGLLKSLKDK